MEENPACKEGYARSLLPGANRPNEGGLIWDRESKGLGYEDIADIAMCWRKCRKCHVSASH